MLTMSQVEVGVGVCQSVHPATDDVMWPGLSNPSTVDSQVISIGGTEDIRLLLRNDSVPIRLELSIHETTNVVDLVSTGPVEGEVDLRRGCTAEAVCFEATFGAWTRDDDSFTCGGKSQQCGEMSQWWMCGDSWV